MSQPVSKRVSESDPAPAAEYSYGFGFSESDLGALAYMQPALRHVLLKRGNQSTLLKMDLNNLGSHLTTLNGRAALVPQKSAADTLSGLASLLKAQFYIAESRGALKPLIKEYQGQAWILIDSTGVNIYEFQQLKALGELAGLQGIEPRP